MSERKGRIFPEFPENFKCPICGGNKNAECWLIPVDGTEDGNTEEAKPIHVACTGSILAGKMRYNPQHNIIYAFVEEASK